ncbi:tetratricopeptide repeat protein [Marinimicrobium sp. ABcell2]|uniref:YfgM family protein n=1 Tax=Marinimicrobium sp. ABcell2 TaxID=3069751 RepID=UPI0027B4C28F|nr:tetratricopeptide repeat protein [Marinimicrobium sp. ABcell2]MDQ2077269.1 tetratricopeptide repeat protein [Marinimicrobium sp. ABcell2]
MSDHLTEEEQLEALKRWWKENGKWVVTAVVLSVGGYFGWNAWQDQRLAQAHTASAQYEALLDSVDAGEPATGLVEEIKQTSRNSQYAFNAAFLRAKAAIDEEDLETAANELEWVLTQASRGPVSELARVRLARVLTAQSAYDEALRLLEEGRPSESIASKYDEARGDILLRQGNIDGARAAYQRALEGLDQAAQNRAALLEMKLDNLATPATAGSALEENAS